MSGFDLSDLPAVCTPDEIAPAIHTTVSALAQDQYLHKGIPYTKVGRRVFYARRIVAQYLIDNTHTAR